MTPKQEIVQIIQKMSGRYSGHQIFTDWVTCSAIAICNRCTLFEDDVFKQRESEYATIMSKYTEDERNRIAEMFALLVKAYEEEFGDVLGEIYMEAELGSKQTGQFFTPYHVSELCAKLATEDSILPPDDEMTVLNLYEPTCGSGGMIIAAAARMQRAGINYQKRFRVVAQDLDWRCVYMCYVQLSLLGIDAVVVQGDTLSEPYRKGYDRRRVLYTPRRAGCLI